ncbi:G5 domain-containing protein [Neobacillus sp. SM06]|uniref:G5 domain-containing protein n=1 Tax=Neobacillus sp. SM06 TaxID=3422492 RepID=UPI003D2C522A
MKKNIQLLKLFFAISGSTAIIFSSAYFGSKLYGDFKKSTATVRSASQMKQKNTVVSTAAPAKKALPVVISQASISSAQLPNDAHDLLGNNLKIELPAESTFSFLGFLKSRKLEHDVSSEALSMIGSLLYQTILPTNFTVEERTISSHLPRFAKIGYETKVSTDQNLDLSFYNPNSTSYTLEFQFNQGILKTVLIGAPLSAQFKIRTSEVQTYKPKTIIQYSSLIEQGKKKITVAGENGRMVKVYKDTFRNQEQIKSELVAEDYYAPVYRVEIHPLIAPAAPLSSQTADPTVAQPANPAESQKLQPGADQSSAAGNSLQTDSAGQASSSNANASNLFGKPAELPK